MEVGIEGQAAGAVSTQHLTLLSACFSCKYIKFLLPVANGFCRFAEVLGDF